MNASTERMENVETHDEKNEPDEDHHHQLLDEQCVEKGPVVRSPALHRESRPLQNR